MSRAFVSILAVLLIAVHCTMAFPSNIHEEMTRSERLAVFGSEDSVPEYRVFSIPLSGARRRRETNEPLNWNIDLHDKKINLTLRPTAGYLATKHTPVWLAKSDEYAYQNIRYDPLPTAMSDIGEFKMYHDVENDAAVTIYAHITDGIIIEGIITPYYAIRSLPQRLTGRTLHEGSEITQHDMTYKRSVDTEEATAHVVVFKAENAPNHVKPSALVDLDNLQREKRAIYTGRRRRVPEAVYPEILVVLDHNAIRNRTVTEALRFALALWNGADLIYKNIDRPKIHLNIAGIIIAADDMATPYIAADTSIEEFEELEGDETELSKMDEYFYKEMVRFPINGHDMIIAMTPISMCGFRSYLPPSGSCYTVNENANLNAACLSEREISRMKSTRSNGIIGYTWNFNGVVSAARAIGHILGAESDSMDNGAECPAKEGHVMAKYESSNNNRNLKWSNCSLRFFSQYFSSWRSQCLDNKPRWTETVGEVLPGRWMSMDGQCRNEGFVKACRFYYDNSRMCSVRTCQPQGSYDCVPFREAPLPGSECYRNMHCDTKRRCISN